MEPLDTQSLPFSIEVSRGRFRNSRSKRPQRNETNSPNEDAKEILPENRSRQGPEIGANPDGSGRGKIPGFGGRQNLVTFQLKSCLKFDDFGSEQAPGPFGGFSGRPKRDVRRAARRDLQDDQRHHPRALVHHVFVPSLKEFSRRSRVQQTLPSAADAPEYSRRSRVQQKPPSTAEAPEIHPTLKIIPIVKKI